MDELIEEKFNKDEEFWNSIVNIEEEDFDDERINRLLRWKEVFSNLDGVKTILDVGAATGAFSIPLAEMGYKVTHLDITPGMLSKAEEKAKSKGLNNITFICGDGRNLSRFKGSEFDLVISFDGAVSFSGKDADKVVSECCRVGKMVILSVSNKACMTATWLNYSIENLNEIHPAVKEMMMNGYWNKSNYEDGEKLTSINELQSYSVKELEKLLLKENMIIKDVRSIGSLSQLYLIHLYRQYSNEEVRKKINNLSYEKEFIELCDKFDKDILNKGIGSFRRAGIIAIAEKPAIIIEETKEVPMKLLLMADPEINAVNKYINESLIFIAQNYEEVIGVIAIKKINEEIYEIMNLAVDNAYRSKGVGKKLINKAVETVKALGGRKIIIGTGNSSIIPLMIYQKAGFTIYEIKKNFFIDNYRDEIWENGIRCTDMIMLEKNI